MSQPNKGTDRPLKSRQSHPPPSPSSPPAPSSPPHQHIPTHWHCNCQGRFSQRGTWSVSRPASHWPYAHCASQTAAQWHTGITAEPEVRWGTCFRLSGSFMLTKNTQTDQQEYLCKGSFFSPLCTPFSVAAPGFSHSGTDVSNTVCDYSYVRPFLRNSRHQRVRKSARFYDQLGFFAPVKIGDDKIYYCAISPLCVRENEASRLPTSWPKTRSETPRVATDNEWKQSPTTQTRSQNTPLSKSGSQGLVLYLCTLVSDSHGGRPEVSTIPSKI